MPQGWFENDPHGHGPRCPRGQGKFPTTVTLGVTSQAAVSLGFTAALVDVVLHECNHLLKLVLELGALCRGVGVQGGHDLQERWAHKGQAARSPVCQPHLPHNASIPAGARMASLVLGHSLHPPGAAGVG